MISLQCTARTHAGGAQGRPHGHGAHLGGTLARRRPGAGVAGPHALEESRHFRPALLGRPRVGPIRRILL